MAASVAPSGTQVVIVTVDAPAGLLPELVAHARSGIERFPDYPGYQGGILHVRTDGTGLVQVVYWESEAAYRACIEDPAWESLPTAGAFHGAIQSGRAAMDVRTYRVESVSEGRRGPVERNEDPESDRARTSHGDLTA